MWLFTRKTKSPAPVRRGVKDVWKPSHPLIQWSRRDALRLRDLCEGVLILGATGSGKTSGSGRAIAEASLKARFGALVLAAKPGERDLWESYCRRAGRLRDLVVFGPEEPWRFNVLDYELNRVGRGAGLTETVVNLLYIIVEMSNR